MTTRQQVEKLVKVKEVRRLTLANLKVDPAYQRGIKRGHRKIVDDFDQNAIGVLTVGQREDGSLWLVDGLQRSTALQLLGYKDALCVVFNSKGVEDEAVLFKKLNLDRTKLLPEEEFKGLLAAHDPSAWLIKEAVESCGCLLNLNKKGRGKSNRVGSNGNSYKLVGCVKELREVLKKYGAEAIKYALTITTQAWPGEPRCTHFLTIGGLATFYNNYKNAPKMTNKMLPQNLVPRLQQFGLNKIHETAHAATLSGNKRSAFSDVLKKVSESKLRKS